MNPAPDRKSNWVPVTLARWLRDFDGASLIQIRNQSLAQRVRASKNMIKTIKFYQRFCHAGLILAFSFFMALPVYGLQQGANGTNGIDGDPGTNGGDGEDGSDVDAVQGLVYSVANGNAGGNGGNGGKGVDEDGDLMAAGGNSGMGGRGGDATAHFIGPTGGRFPGRAFAFGGNGGSGGMFGKGTSRSLDGRGGNGGDGGNATATAHNIFRDARATAIGGNGGNAYGPNAFAGNGGFAHAQASTSADTRNPYPNLLVEKRGGSGGTGFIGATGGNGASVGFGSDSEFEIGSTEYGVFGGIFMRGTGGSGGTSENGVAGTAGDATVDLIGIRDQVWNVTPNSRTAGFALTGGYGGKGLASGNQHVSGTHGGTATLTGQTTFESLGYGNYQFDLRGGNGGSAVGQRNLGNGGHGGSATTDAIQISNSFPNTFGATLNVRATFTGGDGGHANGTGRAGDGAHVDLSNKFTLTTKSEGSMFLEANGGNGGWGRFNGDGGDAVIDSNQAVQQSAENFTGLTWISHRAFGGSAGQGVAGLNSAKGGNAWASAIEKSINRLTVNVTSIGGIGNYGKSGDAFSRALATTTGGGGSDRFRSAAYARSDSQRIIDFNHVLPSIGTNSVAEARALAHSNSDASARADANGGWGFLESGHADSTASAQTLGSGKAFTLSQAFAQSDRDAQTENYSTSTAISKSASGRAEATSVAGSNGHFNRNHATASIDANQGFAYSETNSLTTNWEHDAKIMNRVGLSSTSPSTSQIDSSSYFGFRQTGFADTANVESRVDFLLVPEQSFAHTVISDSGIEDVFGANSDMLGLGMFGAGAAGDPIHGQLEVDSSIDMSLRLQPFHDDKNLVLGMFGVGSTGNGFDELAFSATFMGQSLIDESFTNLADAEAFFDGQLFDLGELNNQETLIDFQFNFAMTMTDTADSFKFGFVFGNTDPRMGNSTAFTFGGGADGPSSVPEPASAALLLVTLVCLIYQRRRKRNVLRATCLG